MILTNVLRRASFLMAIILLESATGSCPTQSPCPAGNSCCPPRGNPLGVGCASLEAGNATCCSDAIHACPQSYTCDVARKRCISTTHGELPDPRLSSDWPLPMGMNSFQPIYRLCHGPLPKFDARPISGRPDLTVPFYAKVPTAHTVTFAVIVVHGSARNADDYFCTGVEAATLQQHRDSNTIAVFAPHFLEDEDQRSPGELYWNMSFPTGNWKGGGESSPKADSTGKGATASSFDVLDFFISELANRTTYPALTDIAVIGHSAGGQTVHRYALAAKAPPKTNIVHVRYVVSNPSTFTYFDNQRWFNGTDGVWSLKNVPPSVVSECPEALEYFYGLSKIDTVPYFRGRDMAHEAIVYAQSDVTYVAGNNDTCNEDLILGCESHGLDRSCGAMLQGPYRRFRAEHYFFYLQQKFGDTLKHRIAFVPNVGHDHSLIFESTQGLTATFGLGS